MKKLLRNIRIEPRWLTELIQRMDNEAMGARLEKFLKPEAEKRRVVSLR
jgi:hypothetical protein